jgi:hypothetical protein
LECNREKNAFAIENTQSLINAGERREIVWGSILEGSDMDNMINVFPEIAENDEYLRWNSIDVENIKRAPYVYGLIPEKLDFVLFDGGEFTTYFEFFKLFNRCTNYIALDDVKVAKCRKIHEYLTESPEWEEVCYIEHPNGFSIFKKKPAVADAIRATIEVADDATDVTDAADTTDATDATDVEDNMDTEV